MAHPKCIELAGYLIPDCELFDRKRDDLAQHIHDAVEIWLNLEWDRMRANLPAPPERVSS